MSSKRQSFKATIARLDEIRYILLRVRRDEIRRRRKAKTRLKPKYTSSIKQIDAVVILLRMAKLRTKAIPKKIA